MRETPSYEQSICERCGTMQGVDQALRQCQGCITATCHEQEIEARQESLARDDQDFLRSVGMVAYNTRAYLIALHVIQKRSAARVAD